MLERKINDNCYEIVIYDWVESQDDYVCGHVKREPDESNDLKFWMFYPSDKKPMNCSDLRALAKFIGSLNIGARE